MATLESPVESIFFAVLAKEAPEERAAYMDEVCASDSDLRRRVERLLAAHLKVGGFLQGETPLPVATLDLVFSHEGPGTVIGPYQLIRPLGEGGMGTVYLAEQAHPVQRQVALKLIKGGMDSAQVVARFEQERQALALMDHPHIAKVLDAGATDDGLPYFVMELVEGQPITSYCDEQKLTPRRRLELFVPVCQAVQHAHQKGVIHRDLKPSNILIARYDGRPVPKVIDFGIAKAAGPRLIGETLHTEVGSVVGTLEYMSPEQAEPNQLDVDTRSDVYALGVLLYELLTGTTPLERAQLKGMTLLEALRVIREEESPRPSTRLSTTKDLGSIAASRGLDPRKLSGLMRGDLDLIVMKCLEKDRSRRYETANALALDLQRYLSDEPVQACPPSAAYRLRKFARRNKGKLAAAAVLGLALLLAVSVLGWAVRDRSAREDEAQRARAAREARVTGQVRLILDEVARLEREQKWPEALDAARRAADLLTGSELEAEVAGQVQDTIRALELVRLLEEIRADRSDWKESGFDDRGTTERYAAAFRDGGIDLDLLTAEEAARRVQSRPGVLAALASALDDWAICRHNSGDQPGVKSVLRVAGLADPDPWRQKIRQAFGGRDWKAVLTLAEAPDLARQPAVTLANLGVMLKSMGRMDAALGVLSLARRQHPSSFWVHFAMAQALHDMRPPNLEQAAGSYRTALGLRPRNAAAWNNLGNTLRAQGNPDEAIDCLNKAIELDPKNASFQSNLGSALYSRGNLNDAIACYQRAIGLDPKLALAHHNLGVVLVAQKKSDDAIASHRKAIELDPKLAVAHHNLGLLLGSQGKRDDAIACYRRAIKLDPTNANFHNNLGVALSKQGKADDALACFKRAIELDPKYALAHDNLGAVLAARKKPDEAIACYRMAIELDPKLATAYVKLGIILCDQKKDYYGAAAAFRTAISLQPDVPATHFNLGLTLRLNGDLAEAITAFREAIRLQPNLAIAHTMLARCLTTCPDLKLRNPQDALWAATKAVELAPQSELAWLAMGWANYRVGEWKASIGALEKSMALQTAPKGGDARQWFFLALAHRQTGSNDEARRWYDKAVAWMNEHAAKDEELLRIRAEAEDVLKIKK